MQTSVPFIHNNKPTTPSQQRRKKVTMKDFQQDGDDHDVEAKLEEEAQRVRVNVENVPVHVDNATAAQISSTTSRAALHHNMNNNNNNNMNINNDKKEEHHSNSNSNSNYTNDVEWEDYKSSTPKHQQNQQHRPLFDNNDNDNTNNNNSQEYIERQNIHHRAEQFWHHYDQCIILSLGAQLGVLIRRTSNYLWSNLNLVFTENSALAPDLPVNCLALFILGLLSSGEDALGVLRYEPSSLLDERREIALDAFERRMLASMSLVLFPAKREEVDALVTYRVDDDDYDYDYDDDYKQEDEEDCFMYEHCDTTKQSNSNHTGIASGEGTQQMQRRPSTCSTPSNGMITAPPQIAVASPTLSSSSSSSPRRRRHRNYNSPRRKRATRDGNSRRRRRSRDGSDHGLQRHYSNTSTSSSSNIHTNTTHSTTIPNNNNGDHSSTLHSPVPSQHAPHSVLVETGAHIENMTNLEHFTWQTEQTALTIAEGWDVGTTPEAMKEDLMLGLRVGFCGALSTFSSWNEDMVNLLRRGYVDHALVGYMLGITLPMVAYRIGQHVAISVFLHRARSQIMRDERRTGGYGLRIHRSEDADDDEDSHYFDNGSGSDRRIVKEDVTERFYPSVRAAVTSFFALLVVAQVTSIFVFPSRSEQQFAISLLFSPLGVLARRQLLQLNQHHTARSLWRKFCGTCFPACFMDYSETTSADGEQQEDPRVPRTKFSGRFPIGTFLCNILGCILSGSIGSLLAENPGPTEGIVLESIILGFAGSLSTLAFLVEVLNGIDVLLAEFSGITYALSTLFWGLIVGLVSSIVA